MVWWNCTPLFGITTLLRICQRIYFSLKGNQFRLCYNPHEELRAFIQRVKCQHQKYAIKGSDNTLIHYDRLGNGSKVVLLANGIGTRLFIWLPAIQQLYFQQPDFFDEYTLICVYHRGLFRDQRDEDHNVEITMEKCRDDVFDIMRHSGIQRLHAMIGWSCGAQITLNCCDKDEIFTERVMLLNPCTGKALNTLFQILVPLPDILGEPFGRFMFFFLKNILRPICDTQLWQYLKSAVY